MLERKVDGVAMMTSEMDMSLIKELGKRNVPIVFMDVGQMGPRMSHVAIDYGNGIRQAVNHVVALGHRNIAFISGPLDLHSARTRRQSFLDSMRHHNLPPDRKMIREGTHSAEGGEQAMGSLIRLSRPPTAVVCSNDWTAIGALHAAHAAGLRVPEDISIVGFDDIPMAQYANPPLTTVRMTARDVGATAFNALFRLIGEEAVEGDVYQIPTKLIVRSSTGRPPRRK
jgi:LacI family transcriptional regulator